MLMGLAIGEHGSISFSALAQVEVCMHQAWVLGNTNYMRLDTVCAYLYPGAVCKATDGTQ